MPLRVDKIGRQHGYRLRVHTRPRDHLHGRDRLQNINNTCRHQTDTYLSVTSASSALAVLTIMRTHAHTHTLRDLYTTPVETASSARDFVEWNYNTPLSKHTFGLTGRSTDLLAD